MIRFVNKIENSGYNVKKICIMNNVTLIIVLVFVLLLLVFFASIPREKAYVSAKCFKMVIGVLPISKICQAIIEYFKNKGK